MTPRQIKRHEIVTLFQQGMRKAEIAKQVGVSYNTVQKWINRYECGQTIDVVLQPDSGRPPLKWQYRAQVQELLQSDPADVIGKRFWTLEEIRAHIVLKFEVEISIPYLYMMVNSLPESNFFRRLQCS